MIAIIIILLFLIVLLLTVIGFAAFYLLRFSRIILSIEDTLSDALLTLQSTESSLESLANKQLFFESREIQQMVKESMEELSMSKLAVGQVIKNFTNLSNQKYIITRINDDDFTSDDS
jgi:hypothetical protein